MEENIDVKERIDYLSSFVLAERFERMCQVVAQRTRYMTICLENTFHPQNASAVVRTAEALGLRPLFMGYGAVGITRSGCGSVPDVATAYPYCFHGVRADVGHPEYTVINHGANDRGASVEAYVSGYRRLLDLVFETHPETRVFAVVAFRTKDEQADALGEMIAAYRAETGHDVHYVDSRPFSPDGPLHPYRDGHEIIAKGLTEALRPLL